MAGVDFVKWLLPLGIGGALGLFFWSGMSVLTLKTVILWLLITFGFLTLIFHAFGSSMLGLLRRLLGFGASEEKQASFSDEELLRRRQTALAKKQGIFDQKNHQYQQNVMIPKQETELMKKQAEHQKFHPHWKGEGHRLGNTAPEHICTCGQSHEIDTDDMDGDSLIDYIEDSQSESEQEEQIESKQEHGVGRSENTVRQRKKNKTDLNTDSDISIKKNSFYMNEEPTLGSPGTITVALRCPNGETTKRRFHVESHIQVLVDFAEALGYTSTEYCIMTTYPRKPLINTTQTLTEAGLTQDVVLVIDDKEE